MDKSCPHIMNVGPHTIIDFKPMPGYYLPHAVLDNTDFYMCKLTAAECDSINYHKCPIYIESEERMLEKTLRKNKN